MLWSKRSPNRCIWRFERFFAGVCERRMPDIVNEGEGLRQIFVEPEHVRDCAGDLRHLDRMGQAVAEMIGDAGREDLRLVFQTAKSARVDDAVAVALEGVAVRMPGLGISPPAGCFDGKPQMRQHERCYLDALNATSAEDRLLR